MSSVFGTTEVHPSFPYGVTITFKRFPPKRTKTWIHIRQSKRSSTIRDVRRQWVRVRVRNPSRKNANDKKYNSNREVSLLTVPTQTPARYLVSMVTWRWSDVLSTDRRGEENSPDRCTTHPDKIGKTREFLRSCHLTFCLGRIVLKCERVTSFNTISTCTCCTVPPYQNSMFRVTRQRDKRIQVEVWRPKPRRREPPLGKDRDLPSY